VDSGPKTVVPRGRSGGPQFRPRIHFFSQNRAKLLARTRFWAPQTLPKVVRNPAGFRPPDRPFSSQNWSGPRFRSRIHFLIKMSILPTDPSEPPDFVPESTFPPKPGSDPSWHRFWGSRGRNSGRISDNFWGSLEGPESRPGRGFFARIHFFGQNMVLPTHPSGPSVLVPESTFSPLGQLFGTSERSRQYFIMAHAPTHFRVTRCTHLGGRGKIGLFIFWRTQIGPPKMVPVGHFFRSQLLSPGQ